MPSRFAATFDILRRTPTLTLPLLGVQPLLIVRGRGSESPEFLQPSEKLLKAQAASTSPPAPSRPTAIRNIDGA